MTNHAELSFTHVDRTQVVFSSLVEFIGMVRPAGGKFGQESAQQDDPGPGRPPDRGFCQVTVRAGEELLIQGLQGIELALGLPMQIARLPEMCEWPARSFDVSDG